MQENNNFKQESYFKHPLFFQVIFLCLFILIGMAYSTLILASNSQILDSIITIFFLLASVCSTYYIFKNNSYYCWALILGIHLGIFLGIVIFSPPQNTIWVIDSLTSHKPNALIHAESFAAGRFPSTHSPQGNATHFWIGFFFFLFGNNIYASVIGQYILKIFTCFLIFSLGKNLLNKKLGELSCTIYALSPTPLFYTTVFYKEFMVHFLYVAIMYFLYKSIISQKKLSALLNILLIFPFFYLIMLERFYFLVLLSSSFFIFLFNKNKKTIIAKATLLCFILYYVITKYSLSYQFLSVNLQTIASLRAKNLEFLDILHSYNYNIPYILALVKIILTPFFSLNKFTIFFDFAQLLIWGSFVHQFIVLTAMSSFVLYLLHFRRYVVFLSFGMPFLLFILFAAYISPWAGRIRDSFYPLISIFAALFFLSIKKNNLRKIPFNIEFQKIRGC